jgi:hypothetical protein
MLMVVETPETVTEAVQLLEAKGYGGEFALDERGFGCRACSHVHPPDRVVVEATYRFEGVSDPGDASIVLGVRCPVCGVAGIIVSAYGADAEPQLLALLSLLDRPAD